MIEVVRTTDGKSFCVKHKTTIKFDSNELIEAYKVLLNADSYFMNPGGNGAIFVDEILEASIVEETSHENYIKMIKT